MKKAKIALTFVAVLAVVGGALAFKASLPRGFYTEDANKHCVVLTQLQYVTTTATSTNPALGITSIKASVASTAATCPVIFVQTAA